MTSHTHAIAPLEYAPNFEGQLPEDRHILRNLGARVLRDVERIPGRRLSAVTLSAVALAGALPEAAFATHPSTPGKPKIEALAKAPKMEAAPPLQYVGVVEPRFMYSNPEEAIALANNIKDAGFNLVRLVEYDHQGEDGNLPDKDQFCVAASAILNAGLNLEVTFRGEYPDNHLGWVPNTPGEINDLQSTMAAYESLLGGPNKCIGLIDPNPEVPQTIAFQATDEWNLDLFVDDPANAISSFVQIHKTIYPALKQLANELGITFQIWAVGTTSAHQPFQEYQAIGKEMKKQHVTASQLFDVITHHPYMEFSSTPPSKKYGLGRWGVSDFPLFSTILKKYMGYSGPVMYDEFGVQTEAEADKQSLYQGTQPNVNKVDEATQANYYTLALKIVACQKNDDGVPNMGLAIMHFVDNSGATESWRASGLENPDGSPKSSLAPVSEAIKAARAGTLTKCAVPLKKEAPSKNYVRNSYTSKILKNRP